MVYAGSPSSKSDLKPRASSSGWMSSRCRFSTHCASIASASVSLTTRTGSFSSSASFAALRRRAPATTSYLLSSSSRTRRGARIPCVLKLAASSSRLFASKRLRGFVADSASAVIGTLRYSWLLAAFCVLGIIFSPLMCLWLDVGGLSAHVGPKNQTVQALAVLCGCRECRWLGGNAPENHGSGLLNGFQALAQEIGVSVPKLDVVLGCGSVLKSDRLADHKGHGFGFGLADLFGGKGAAVATVEHFVGDLMHERGKLLGWLHPCKQRDLPAIRQTLRGSNSLGETKLDALRFHELKQTFAVSAHVAIDFGQCWEFFAFGLVDIENIDGPESVERPLTLRGCVFTRLVGRYILRASPSDHRVANENAFLSPFNEAAKRVPCPKSGNVGGIGLLTCDEHDVAKAVGGKLCHCSEVCGEDFTVTGLQRCDEEIHGLFGACVDFF